MLGDNHGYYSRIHQIDDDDGHDATIEPPRNGSGKSTRCKCLKSTILLIFAIILSIYITIQWRFVRVPRCSNDLVRCCLITNTTGAKQCSNSNAIMLARESGENSERRGSHHNIQDCYIPDLQLMESTHCTGDSPLFHQWECDRDGDATISYNVCLAGPPGLGVNSMILSRVFIFAIILYTAFYII